MKPAHLLRAACPVGSAVALALVATGQTPDPAHAVRWEPYTGEAADGSPLDGRMGRIRVPERRGVEGSATIEIAFVVYASEAASPGPPIVYLAGGPGASGVEHCAREATDPRLRLLDHGDVIGIDQRGTGQSRPNLSDGPAFEYELPLDRPVTRDELAAAYAGAVARCVDHWTGVGVDLAAYDTEESADDVEAVRAALGLDEIRLWGTSYGSHLALSVLRRHPEHVARAVLMKVEGPDDTWKLPSTVQRRLEQVHERVAADPALAEAMPDFLGTVRGLLRQLEAEPVTATVERGGEVHSVVIGPLDVQVALSEALGFASMTADLPLVVHMMTQGEWRHMMGVAFRDRTGSVDSAMALSMDCSSGASAARMKRIERERKDPANLLSDAISAPFYPSTCAPCGESALGKDFREPFRCDVPVLFVSGDLDARTPPENVEAIRKGFTHHAHVLVEGTGHDARELESEAYRELVHAFLAGGEVASTTIHLQPVEFRPLGPR